MSRPLHIILLTLPHLISLLKNQAGGYNNNSEEETLDVILIYASQSSYFIMVFLPLFWLLGVLPPFEPFVLWLTEQVQIFLFGGTSSASLMRCLLQMLVSFCHLVLLATLAQCVIFPFLSTLFGETY
jgi:hypothetical protein